jgi:hypothetical protein
MAKMSDILTVKNPISGEKSNLADPSDWIQNILGVLFLYVIFATGQKVAKTVEQKTKIDTSPEWGSAAPATTNTSNAPAFRQF